MKWSVFPLLKQAGGTYPWGGVRVACHVGLEGARQCMVLLWVIITMVILGLGEVWIYVIVGRIRALSLTERCMQADMLEAAGIGTDKRVIL